MQTLNVENLVERQKILSELYEVAQELRKLAKDNNISPANKRRVSVYKSLVYCYSTILGGLEKAENDLILARLDRLEAQRGLIATT